VHSFVGTSADTSQQEQANQTESTPPASPTSPIRALSQAAFQENSTRGSRGVRQAPWSPGQADHLAPPRTFEPEKMTDSPRFAQAENGSQSSSVDSYSDAESKSSLASFANREHQRLAGEELDTQQESSSPEPARRSFSFQSAGGATIDLTSEQFGDSPPKLSRCSDIVKPLHLSRMKANAGKPSGLQSWRARLKSPSSDNEPGAVHGAAVRDEKFCEFHKLDADSDCEIHHLADSDSASCATETCDSDTMEERRVGG